MNMLNLEGKIVADGKSAVDYGLDKLFTVAVERTYKENDETKTEISYFDCVCYGKLANLAQKNAKKDRCVRIVGRLKQVRIIDIENEKPFSKVVLVVEHIEFKPLKKAEKE